MGGLRYTAGNGDLQDDIIDVCAELQLFGGAPSHIFMNPIRLADLTKSLNSNNIRKGVEEKGAFSFSSIEVFAPTPSGVVKVMADHRCPKYDHRLSPPEKNDDGFSGTSAANSCG